LLDGFYIRRSATERRIPCFTSLDTLRAALDGVTSPDAHSVRTVGEYRGVGSESAQIDGLWPGTPVPAGHIVGIGRDEVSPARVARRSGLHS
jgi:hypothetical protein